GLRSVLRRRIKRPVLFKVPGHLYWTGSRPVDGNERYLYQLVGRHEQFQFRNWKRERHGIRTLFENSEVEFAALIRSALGNAPAGVPPELDVDAFERRSRCGNRSAR